MQEKQQILEHLKKIKESNILIIVEGPKDKAALEYFGINNIQTLSKQPIYKIVENIAEKHKECIILTDLDKEGKKLFGKLNSGLSRFGVRIKKQFREFLFKETKLRQIEGLISYIKKIEN